MSNADIQKQQATLSRLADELERLNQNFDAAKRAMSVTDEDLAKEAGNVPAELADAMRSAEAEAREAGRRAAAQLEAEAAMDAEPAGGCRRPRRGAISI